MVDSSIDKNIEKFISMGKEQFYRYRPDLISEKIAYRLVKESIEGDIKFSQYITDRLDGRSTQKKEDFVSDKDKAEKFKKMLSGDDNDE